MVLNPAVSWARCALALTLAAGLGACADRPGDPVAPAAAVEPVVSGQVTTELLGHGGAGLSGTLTSRVEMVRGDEGASSTAHALRFTGAEGITAAALGITFSSVATSAVGDLLGLVSTVRSSGGVVRVQSSRPGFAKTMPDGRELLVVPIGEAGPAPRGLALYVDGELRILTHFGSSGRGPRRATASVTSLHFGDGDASPFITRHDVSELVDRSSELMEPDVTPLIGDCETQIIPDPDCAGDDGPCLAEKLAVGAAFVAYLAAETALALALASCPITGVTCPGVIAAAAALSASAVALATAQMALQNCLASSGGGSGGPGDGDMDCETYILEISYDDGATWQYLATVTICD